MEIYAAAKRDQTASTKPKAGTAKKSAAPSSSAALQKAQIEEAQMEKFQRNREALTLIEEQAREAEEKFRQAASRRLADPEKEEGEDSGEFEAMAEYLKVMQRCQEIARRLMRGDRVPPEDEQYLMTNDPKGYKLALAARKPNPHPTQWESVLEDVEGAETTAAPAAGSAAGEVRSLFGGDRGDGEGGGEEGSEDGGDAEGG